MGAAGKRIFNDEFYVTSEILIGCENKMRITRISTPKEAEQPRTWSVSGLQTEFSDTPGRRKNGDSPAGFTDVAVYAANL